MLNRKEPRALIALLLWLAPAHAAAQDNPWRVPGYGDAGAWNSGQQYNDAPATRYGPSSGGNPYGGSGGAYYGGSSGNYPGGSGNYYGGNSGSNYSGSSWPNAEAKPLGGRAEGSGAAGDRDSYASLDRGAGGAVPYQGAPANQGWRQNGSGYGADFQRPGGYYNPGYAVPLDAHQSYLYGRQYGEFPPLEGERRMQSPESLPPQRLPQQQSWQQPQQPWQQHPAAAQTYSYGYGPSYGYGYGNGIYPGATQGLPSTLGNPWGAYGPAYGLFPTPYGLGVPGLYGW
jgi:hypothetical protein